MNSQNITFKLEECIKKIKYETLLIVTIVRFPWKTSTILNFNWLHFIDAPQNVDLEETFIFLHLFFIHIYFING